MLNQLQIQTIGKGSESKGVADIGGLILAHIA
jgi:hypothetical protein